MTNEISRKLIEGQAIILSKFPFFAVLLLTLHKLKETGSVQTAATDERTIYLNPDFLAGLSSEETAFLLAHECGHTMYHHLSRARGYQDMVLGPDGKPFNFKKWNIAADYAVNGMLVDAGLKAMPQGGYLNPQYSEMLVDEIYCLLPDKDDDDDNGNGDKPGGHGGFDEHMAPAADAPDEGEVAVAVTQAANAQKSMGTMPAGLQRLVDELLTPKKHWRDILAAHLRQVSGNDEVSWRRLNRRKLGMAALTPHEMPFYPGTSGYAMGDVVVVLDTSGSIGQPELTRFLSEVGGILGDCTPEKIWVLWTDSEVAGVDEPATVDDLASLTPMGGGGTNMPAAFDWVDANQVHPDAMVILTDGYTPFGSPQPYPVIWAITSEHIDAPHGTTVHVEL